MLIVYILYIFFILLSPFTRKLTHCDQYLRIHVVLSVIIYVKVVPPMSALRLLFDVFKGNLEF